MSPSHTPIPPPARPAPCIAPHLSFPRQRPASCAQNSMGDTPPSTLLRSSGQSGHLVAGARQSTKSTQTRFPPPRSRSRLPAPKLLAASTASSIRPRSSRSQSTLVAGQLQKRRLQAFFLPLHLVHIDACRHQSSHQLRHLVWLHIHLQATLPHFHFPLVP